ncbi:hypothetical protein ACTA71_007194 [Dictyostelium dimigraforme]
MFTSKLNIILLIITISICISITHCKSFTPSLLSSSSSFSSSSSSSSSKNKYLYSISSVSPNVESGQIVLVIDPLTNEVIKNKTVYIPYRIIDLLDVDESSNSLLFFCLINNAKNLLLSLNLETFEFKEIGGTYGGWDYTYARQPYIFVNDNVFLPAKLSFYNATGLTVLHWDFTDKSEMGGSFHIIELPIEDFDTESGIPPMGGYDYVNNLLYVTYQSLSDLSENNSTSIICFNPFSGDANSTHRVHSGITNLVPGYIHLLFTDQIEGGSLYALSRSFDTQSSIEVCKINFQTNNCDQILAKDMGPFYNSFDYRPYFIGGHQNSDLILLEFTEKSTKPYINFQSVNLLTWNETSPTLVSNYWTSTFGPTYLTFTFFAYV